MNQAVEGEVLERPTFQIVEYSETAQALASLRQRYGSVVFDVSDKKQLAQAKEARAEIKGYRVALEKKRKDLKASVLERGRLIDGEAKQIETALLALEEPIDDTIKAEERRKAEAEERRVAGIRLLVDEIKALPGSMLKATAAELALKLEHARSFRPAPEVFAEFVEAATLANESTISQLETLHRAAVEREAEALRQAQERERLDRERAELEQRQAEQRKREEEDEARRREAREREEAELAERRRKVQEEEDRIAAAKREQEARDAEARRQQEAKEKAARDRKDAAERKKKLAAQARLDDRQLLQDFAARHAGDEFAPVVQAIEAYFQANP